jgi:hypothetical protein
MLERKMNLMHRRYEVQTDEAIYAIATTAHCNEG